MIRLPETLSASKRVPRWRILSYFLFVFFGEKNLFTLNSGGRAYETTPTDAIWESVAFSLDRKQLEESRFIFGQDHRRLPERREYLFKKNELTKSQFMRCRLKLIWHRFAMVRWMQIRINAAGCEIIWHGVKMKTESRVKLKINPRIGLFHKYSKGISLLSTFKLTSNIMVSYLRHVSPVNPWCLFGCSRRNFNFFQKKSVGITFSK